MRLLVVEVLVGPRLGLAETDAKSTGIGAGNSRDRGDRDGLRVAHAAGLVATMSRGPVEGAV